MSIPDNCPNCGAPKSGEQFWQCGTWPNYVPTGKCMERQAHQETARKLLQSIAVEAELREDLSKCQQESASHASTATILGFECQRLQAEVNDLKKRLAAFTDL